MKNRIVSLFLAIVMICSLLLLPACQEEKNTKIKVMLEQGAHFQVVGESVKEISIGEDVSFEISIDEGYYYVSNNLGAEFKDSQLILKNVSMPTILQVEVSAYTYMVQLNEIEGLKVYDGEQFIQKTISTEVEYGGTAVFDIQIDEGYEYVNNTVNSANGAQEKATYLNGKLSLANVNCDKEIFLQIRKSAVEEQEKVIVQLKEDEAFILQGERVQEVQSGSNVEFEIVIQEGYYYKSSNCGAEYDAETGKIIFRDARADQEIQLFFGKFNTETAYYTNGRVEMSASGDSIVYTAKANTDYIFSGWSIVEDGNEKLYSYANHLRVIGYEAENIQLKPNFVSVNACKVITYHTNEGKLYNSNDDSITYVFNHEVYLYPAAFGEWGFKTFYREGYVPVEYNTEADGSGEAISFGSRIFLDEKEIDLYVIWEKETSASEFTYTYIKEDTESSDDQTVTYTQSDDWYEGNNVGIKLLKYNGSDVNVAIPTEIEGLPVKVVGGECFTGQNIEKAVITRNVTSVEDGAFAGCSALNTLYMCDSVEIISDEAFADCVSLANLRMLAALPPIYSDHLIGATVRRFEVLYQNRGDLLTNIMFYGGSSIFHGIDGATLTRFFSTDEYRIINCGQNAFVSGALMMELFSYFMDSRDIMVFSPEYSELVYSSRLELPTWIALEAFYDAFRYIDLRDYSNVFNAFYEIQHGSESYVYIGKLKQISEGKGSTYEVYDNTFDEYFTRAENFEITKINLYPREDLPKFTEIKEHVLNTINVLYNEKYLPNGLTMYFSYFGLWEDAYGKDIQAEYEQWLKENLAFPYISNYLDHLYSDKYMSDSMSHLTREGAVLHSNTLAQEMKAQMRLDGYA